MSSVTNIFDGEDLNNSENISVIHVDNELLNLFIDWGLSAECISLLAECGIKSIEILTMMHSHDIDEVFNRREILGEKIKFRHKMQQWRTENNVR